MKKGYETAVKKPYKTRDDKQKEKDNAGKTKKSN